MTKTCKITVKDEVWCYVTGLSETDSGFLWNKFGIFLDGYFFMPAFKMGRFDGKIRFFDKQGKTYYRLLDQIVPIIDAWGYDIDLVDNRKPIQNPTTVVDENLFSGVMFGTKPFKLRPYQVECVNLAIDAGSGFIIAGTGAGKTSITAALSKVYSDAGHRTITIVPSGDLVDQTAEWYTMCGMDVGVYSGSSKDIDHDNVVATWQALQYNPEILSKFDCFIWDEAHGVKAAVGQKLINEHGRHIAFRFGVTGTFPKPEVEQMALKSSIGPILREIPAWWLIENGYLAKVTIEPIVIDETYVEEEFVDYSAERAFVSKSAARMEKIADIIISKCAAHGNTLVLVNSISFGQKLASLIKGAVFLYGNSPKDLRKEHYTMFEEHDDLIVIASSGIASTGISIDRIFCLVLVDPLKSFIKAIQSIGRGLRLADDKTEIKAIDIHSKLKWGKKHHKERLKHYREARYPVLKPIVIKVKE